MKTISLIIVALLMTYAKTEASESGTKIYNCSYATDEDERVSIDITTSPEGNSLVYTSEELTAPVFVNLDKQFTEGHVPVLQGDLPYPWSAGCNIRVYLTKGSKVKKVSFYNPNIGHRLYIYMKCQQR